MLFYVEGHAPTFNDDCAEIQIIIILQVGHKMIFGLFVPATKKSSVFVVDTVRSNQVSLIHFHNWFEPVLTTLNWHEPYRSEAFLLLTLKIVYSGGSEIWTCPDFEWSKMFQNRTFG